VAPARGEAVECGQRCDRPSPGALAAFLRVQVPTKVSEARVSDRSSRAGFSPASTKVASAGDRADLLDGHIHLATAGNGTQGDIATVGRAGADVRRTGRVCHTRLAVLIDGERYSLIWCGGKAEAWSWWPGSKRCNALRRQRRATAPCTPLPRQTITVAWSQWGSTAGPCQSPASTLNGLSGRCTPAHSPAPSGPSARSPSQTACPARSAHPERPGSPRPCSGGCRVPG